MPTPKRLPAKGAKKKRSRPEPKVTQDVNAARVAELPPRRPSERTLRFVEPMHKIRAKKIHDWVPIGEFQGSAGARQVKAAMCAGDRPVDGEVEDWDIESRLVHGENGVGSRLYVRLRTGNAKWHALGK